MDTGDRRPGSRGPSQKHRVLWYALIFLTLSTAIAAFAGCSTQTTKDRRAEGGVLDLRDFDFGKGTSAPLTGEWDFIPGSVDVSLEDFDRGAYVRRTVPDLWNGDEAGGSRGQGCGTYRLVVLLPAKSPPFALHYLSASTAFRIEVDGRALVQVGVPSANPEGSRAAYKPGFVRMGELGDRVEILVRVSNYVYRSGGMWYPMFLGPAGAIESLHESEISVAVAQSTALINMAAILLLLFALRRKDRPLLYSGLLTLVLGLRAMVTGEYLLAQIWPGIPFALLIKLEYFTVFLSFPAATAFFCSLFPGLLDRRLEWACLVPSFAFACLACVLPLPPLTRSLFVYYGFVALNIIVLLAALIRRTLRERNFESVSILAGTIVLAASAINDIFYSSFVWWTGNLAPLGFGVFVTFQVIILARRLTGAFAGAEALLDQKELLIKEIHHRVKNNLQVVASLISLQSNRVADPAMKEVFASLRSRVVSMSLVHEKLYGKASGMNLELGEYIQDLVRLIVAKDGSEAGRVNFSFKSETISVPEGLCVDIGLIVTEIVSNSMKHAFLPKGGGELRLGIQREGESVAILVEDDGPGFPEGFEPSASKALGYKLVTSLVKKNGGSIAILPGPGGRVRVDIAPGS